MQIERIFAFSPYIASFYFFKCTSVTFRAYIRLRLPASIRERKRSNNPFYLSASRDFFLSSDSKRFCILGNALGNCEMIARAARRFEISVSIKALTVIVVCYVMCARNAETHLKKDFVKVFLARLVLKTRTYLGRGVTYLSSLVQRHFSKTSCSH